MRKVFFTESQMKRILAEEEQFISYLPNTNCGEVSHIAPEDEVFTDSPEGEGREWNIDTHSNSDRLGHEFGSTNQMTFNKRGYHLEEGQQYKNPTKPFANRFVRQDMNDALKNGEVNPKHQKFINNAANGKVSDEAAKKMRQRANREKRENGGYVFGEKLDGVMKRGLNKISNASTRPQTKSEASTGMKSYSNANKSHHSDDKPVNITYVDIND